MGELLRCDGQDQGMVQARRPVDRVDKARVTFPPVPPNKRHGFVVRHGHGMETLSMRIKFIPALLMLGLLAAGVTGARAATELPFTQQAFTAAQTAGQPILVHIWASWCPTCKAQAPTLSAIEADPANKALVVYKVDFDAQKDVVTALGARVQSTLIAFHGAAEKARSSGMIDPDAIKALVAKAYQ
jgi:thioredoxin 1